MALKVLNKSEKDFSDEFLMLMAAAGYMIYGAQIIMQKAKRECDLECLKDCFFQARKKYVDNAADGFAKMVKNLNVFDDWFDAIQRGRLDYLSYVHQYGNDMAKLALLFVSRCDHDSDSRDNIYKAIRELPADDEANWEQVIEYFNKKF